MSPSIRFVFFTLFFFFFNDTATTEIYTLSLHDTLPIWLGPKLPERALGQGLPLAVRMLAEQTLQQGGGALRLLRSEEHTSELQSRLQLVCRLLLEKKKKQIVKLVRAAAITP